MKPRHWIFGAIASGVILNAVERATDSTAPHDPNPLFMIKLADPFNNAPKCHQNVLLYSPETGQAVSAGPVCGNMQ